MISYSPEAGFDPLDLEEEHQSIFHEEEPQSIFHEAFLQRENCFSTSQCIPPCQECEKNPMTNKFCCRFYEFRKVERANGTVKAVGFLDPHIDPTVEDLDLWTMPQKPPVDKEATDYILSHIATQFCEVSEKELQTSQKHGIVVWKRSVHMVREICDVCDTSVFNLHWTCSKCGTSVCTDCYKERIENISRWKPKTKADKDERDSSFWLKCNAEEHKMILTQMTTGDTLLFLNKNLHKICDERGITQTCGCSLRTNNCLEMQSKGNLLETSSRKETDIELRQEMKRQRHKTKMKMTRRMSLMEQNKLHKTVKQTLISQGRILKILEPTESSDCYKVFQDRWEKGEPVVVSGVTKKLRNLYIWTPVYFSTRFGNEKHALVDCRNGNIINKVAMKNFWDGFSLMKKRLPRDCQEKVVLKLKDWPTSDDFANVMKEHFNDIMEAVPFHYYTQREGRFNLVSYLPEHFSRPDLGPKMYSAYAQMHPSKKGSTNLHLDVSDAVNMMLVVSQPTDAHLAPSQYSKDAIEAALISAGVDQADRNQNFRGIVPGAVWHIFPAHQSDDIRKLLREVAIENGKPLGETDDPIHDQVSFFGNRLLGGKSFDVWTIAAHMGPTISTKQNVFCLTRDSGGLPACVIEAHLRM